MTIETQGSLFCALELRVARTAFFFIFGMAGVPPWVGFFAKLNVINAILEAGFAEIAVWVGGSLTGEKCRSGLKIARRMLELVPEDVLVLEVVGSIEDFHKAVHRVPGLELLEELAGVALRPDEVLRLMRADPAGAGRRPTARRTR